MQAGYQVGQFILERPLGQGGMAEVWLGRNAHLGTPAAVKFLLFQGGGEFAAERGFFGVGEGGG